MPLPRPVSPPQVRLLLQDLTERNRPLFSHLLFPRPPQVRLLLQDLTERRRGHRNVMDEEVEHAFELMDGDGNGEVSK